MIIDYDRKHFGYKFLINYNCVHCSMFKQFWPKNVFSVCNFSRAVIPRGTVNTPPVFDGVLEKCFKFNEKSQILKIFACGEQFQLDIGTSS